MKRNMIEGAGLAIAGAIMVVIGGPAQAQISSTFSSDNQGWQVGDIADPTAATAQGPATWVANGGNPGGYLFTNDVANEVAFLAPTNYTGNLSGYYGGTAAFDTFDRDGSDSGIVASIVLYGAGRSITYGVNGPGTSFTHYVIPLTETGWTFYPGNGSAAGGAVSQSDFQNILSSVSSFAVHADWHSGADDTGLDNVFVTAPSSMQSAVPEPASWAMMIVGFGMIGAGLRYRQRRAVLRYI